MSIELDGAFEVPDWLTEKVEKLEAQWQISRYNYRLVPYHSYSSYGPDGWRLAVEDITDKEKPVRVVEHITASKDLDGHTLMLLLEGMRKSFQFGVLHGQNKAVDNLAKGMAKIIMETRP
jgi:hypothetical protein